MTLFGKFVFTVLGIVLAFGLFYGITAYVKRDTVTPVAPSPVVTEEAQNATTSVATSTDNASSTETVDTTKPPFYQLLAKAGSRKCSVSQMMGTITSNGTVYMDNGTVRAEFSTSVMNTTVNSTMIAKDGYMYSWTDKGTTGTKTKMPTLDRDGNATSTKGVKTWDGSQVKDYTCAPWTVDEAIFEIPKSVTFTETQ